MRALLHATATGLSCAALLIGGGARADEDRSTEVWLREGANISVSATPAGDHFVFGLVGRVWTLDPVDGFATQLSEDDEWTRGPVLSPDGSLIAYETIRDGFHQIMVRDASGEMPRQITFGAVNHRSPSWSPAGPARPLDEHRLIMSSDRGGHYGIWEIDVDTLELQQLTFASSDEREPAWNADGTRIAYVTDTPAGSAIYAVKPGEQPQLLLKERARIRAPAWRPGGGLLTYVRQLKGENQLRMLILSQPTITKPISHGENAFPYPVYWFDRSRFLYTADGQIRRRSFGERNAEPVAFNARLELAPEPWSRRPLSLDEDDNQPVTGSNGRSVAADGRSVLATLGDLWEIGPDGALIRQLTNDPYVDAQPALSPDGTKLAFVSDRGGSLQVWLTDLDTMRTRRLTREHGIALYPEWTEAGAAIEYAAAPHVAATKLVSRRIDVASGRIETAGDAAIGRDEVSPPEDDGHGDVVIPLTWRPFAVSGRRIIRAGRIFDGIGPGYLTGHEIVIDGDRITAVRPWTEDEDAGPDDSDDADVEIVDAREQTVIPGLIDMSIRQSRIADERLGRKYLAYGVTTIREAVTNPAEAIERRESWGSGRRMGPRLLMSSTPCADAPDGFVVRPVLEPAVAQPAFRTRINAAIDRGSVSIGVCRSLNAGTRVDVIATVHARGLSTMTGEVFPDVLLGADETRLPPPELAGYQDFATVTGALGTTVTSNLAATGLALLVHRGDLTTGWQYRQLFTRAEQEWHALGWRLAETDPEELRIKNRALSRGLTAAVARGARVVAGSDAPLVPPGMGLHAELRLLTDAGLQPFQVLRMATDDAGRALGAADRLGIIRPGAIADLVIVDGDPLMDIRDAAHVSMTIAGGRAYTRSELSQSGNRPASVGNLYNFIDGDRHKPLISVGNAYTPRSSARPAKRIR